MDRKFRLCRLWSNKELEKFAGLFDGKIINVSAWQDKDKGGSFYKNYFKNAEEYYLSNYKNEYCGFQGYKGEIFLDLEKKLENNMVDRFDVVFNHTTLEHIYDFKNAFKNLSLLTIDIVLLVVQIHR